MLTAYDFFRIFFCLIVCGSIVWAVYRRDDPAFAQAPMEKRQYVPIVSPYLFLILGLVILIFRLALPGFGAIRDVLIALFFNILLGTAVYDVLLVWLIPFFRKKLQPGACALFWLLPQLLYLLMNDLMRPARPLVTVRLDGTVFQILLYLWAAGAVLYFAGLLLSHFLFRRRLLRDAVREENAAVLAIWEEEKKKTGFRRVPGRLVRSPATETPLTIGLFGPGLRVVLPKRLYTEEELALIFRHEIAHILRGDHWTKFTMQLFAALNWFNPLIRTACRRCGEDLELSCDQLVMRRSGEAEREKYAALLLETAGSSRGFSTCLSADAEALRYRLKGILQPAGKKVGAFTAGLLLFLLLMLSGRIALARENGTFGDAIFSGEEAKAGRVWACRAGSVISPETGYFGTDYPEEAGEALLAALAPYRLYRLYSLSDPRREEADELRLFLHAEGADWLLYFCGDTLQLSRIEENTHGFWQTGGETVFYCFEEAAPWEEIKRVLELFPPT